MLFRSIINGGDGDDTIAGGAGLDTIAGGAGDDTITGGADNDILSGDSGDDTLNGGAGDDRLSGGAGSDVLVGGLGIDTADYSGAAGPNGVTVNLLNGMSSEMVGVEGDYLYGIENVIGSNFNDIILGDASADRKSVV